MSQSLASSSHACSSPAKAPTVPPTGMRSPTKIRTPIKLVRPRETHWASRAKDVKKRQLDSGESHSESALPLPKRLKLSHTEPTIQGGTQAPNTEVPGARGTEEKLQEAKEVEGNRGYADALSRKVEVAQCLEKDLLRDNARMRLKILNLRDEVDFYYGLLTKIELLLAADKNRENTGKSNQEQEQVTKLAEQLRRIISASKAVDGIVEMRNGGGVEHE
ncbi:hypothetical protein L917_19748 [Phytophthora nicotianae]|uniref:Uncharacterized protein n=1 Tax=Phytophthora nicotianae TaxID=4792 RepID=W2MBA1_PHYNI|nr:hypothetical protein L917_19748 [Phytophthora nicotianae]ETM32918.1 hypothetical protein L914_19791 [Phytophthora nicotianae]